MPQHQKKDLVLCVTAKFLVTTRAAAELWPLYPGDRQQIQTIWEPLFMSMSDSLDDQIGDQIR